MLDMTNVKIFMNDTDNDSFAVSFAGDPEKLSAAFKAKVAAGVFKIERAEDLEYPDWAGASLLGFGDWVGVFIGEDCRGNVGLVIYGIVRREGDDALDHSKLLFGIGVSERLTVARIVRELLA